MERGVAVEAVGLSRHFGSTVAVAGLDLRVGRGELFGLVGPDGAGKSTAIRMLATILPPTGGRASVGGFDVVRDSEAIRSLVGYVAQGSALYGELTVADNVAFYADVFGIGTVERDARTAELLAFSGLGPFANRRTDQLSGGMKRKLALAAPLIHRPEIMFLDEPTAGVDPVARRAFWDAIYALAADGATIFVTTHYMDEAEYCHRLALMRRGRLLAVGNPDEPRRLIPASAGATRPTLDDVFVSVVGRAGGESGDTRAE